MPSCSIKEYGARKNNNHPTLTLHRFPVNEILKGKWIKIIGLENINPRHKMWYVCSMHFHETSFNRTLGVTRLRDCAVPLSSLQASQILPKPMLDSRPTLSAMINILICSSKNPVNAINELSQQTDFVEIPEDDSDLYYTYMEYLESTALDEYTQRVLEYIAGFVTRKMSQTIKCVICLSLILGDENADSLIFQKSRSGLQYASAAVVDIINKTEKLIKPDLTTQTKPENYYLYIFTFSTEYYECKNIFYLPLNTEHNINHRLLLIKSVIKGFIDLRFRYHVKKVRDKVSYRNYLNKRILFRNE